MPPEQDADEPVSVAVGLVAGGLAAFWTTRFVTSYLYHLTPGDVRVWSGAVLVTFGTAIAGTLVPALRASRVDPMAALRVE